jgi:hypothetical protein
MILYFSHNLQVPVLLTISSSLFPKKPHPHIKQRRQLPLHITQSNGNYRASVHSEWHRFRISDDDNDDYDDNSLRKKLIHRVQSSHNTWPKFKNQKYMWKFSRGVSCTVSSFRWYRKRSVIEYKHHCTHTTAIKQSPDMTSAFPRDVELWQWVVGTRRFRYSGWYRFKKRDIALKAGRSRVRFPMVSLGFFIDNPSSRTMALGSTQPVTDISTRNISWGVKAAGA